MSNARPSLEGLFNGSATADPPLNWLNGKPAGPEPLAAEPPSGASASALFDPVAVAERYFAILQTLLDLQREFGLRLAHQLAELPGMNRLRR